MATMNVRDSDGATQAIEKPLAPGRAAEGASRPVVLSDEDLAAINAIATALADGSLIAQNAGPSFDTSFGVSGAAFTSNDASSAAAPVTDAPASSQYLTIDEITVSVDTAMIVSFTEETSGTLIHRLYMAANTSIQLRFKRKKLATADKKLEVQTSTSGNITVTADYHSEP